MRFRTLGPVVAAGPIKKSKDKLLNSKLITQVLIVHALADTIQYYATDCGRQDIYKEAGLIRVAADKYGESFTKLGDLLYGRIRKLNYNKRQMLDTLCFVIHSQAKKAAEMYLAVDEKRDYLQLPIARRIQQLTVPCFINSELVSGINTIILNTKREIEDSFKNV